jgi:ferredoxin-type protein NapH
MTSNKKKTTLALPVLKGILWTYIILCLVIAGLNYGYASRATAAEAELIARVWHFYENWVKTLFIVVGSLLTLRIVSTSQRTSLRKKNLIGLTVTALVVHIAGPLLLGNSELYFFAMPLPWTTTPLQLLTENSAFYQSRFPVWGLAGIATALIFYVAVSIVVFGGTLLFGRRWQCSTLCLFNGFAAEVFAPAFPLLGNSRKARPGTLRIFSALRWLFLAMALFFTFYWVLYLVGVPIGNNLTLIGKIENYKYLSAELMMMMFFWVAWSGRGYCYYCPLGTVLGLLSKAAGQRIATDRTHCIQCGQCNRACPMAINIQGPAKAGQPARELRCVGCGHCVDACPTRTLAYSTRFLDGRRPGKPD